MAEKLQFDLVSPERALVSAKVDMVIAPGADGDFGVLAGHAPFISTLRPGVLEVRDGARTDRIFVRGGFAEAGPAGLTVLAEEAVPVAELKAAELDARIRTAQEDVGLAKDDAARALAAETLEGLRQMRAAAGA